MNAENCRNISSIVPADLSLWDNKSSDELKEFKICVVITPIFQKMSELRQKKKSEDKKNKKALDHLINVHCKTDTLKNGSAGERNFLDLHSQNLASCHLLFDSFLPLGELTVLHLDHNQLNFIPNGVLKSLPLLQDLALHNNQLEIIPAEIGELKHLEHLRLNYNSLVSLPTVLRKCSSLISLHFSGNPALRLLPNDMFEEMPCLHHILADQCPQLLEMPASLQCCSKLEFVDIDETVINPPSEVLAAGHDAIKAFYLSSSDSQHDVKCKQDIPSLLNSNAHCMHRDNALKYLDLKRGARMTGTDRCDACWHMRPICICTSLPQVALRADIELVVYMDSKEVYNSGDDAKLLSIICPNQTKRFIYAAEDAELVSYISGQRELNSSSEVVVLFPSTRAVACDDFLSSREQVKAKGSDGLSMVPLNGAGDYKEECDGSNNCDNTSRSPRKLIIIVVDAVWRHARRMAQRLHVLLPAATHVQLSPEQFSVYARKQSQPDRICTVEATALFLSHIGGADSLACSHLVESVRINNNAIRPSSDAVSAAAVNNSRIGKVSKKFLYQKEESASHPCWYYGKEFYHSHGELKAKKSKDPKQKRRYL